MAYVTSDPSQQPMADPSQVQYHSQPQPGHQYAAPQQPQYASAQPQYGSGQQYAQQPVSWGEERMRMVKQCSIVGCTLNSLLLVFPSQQYGQAPPPQYSPQQTSPQGFPPQQQVCVLARRGKLETIARLALTLCCLSGLMPPLVRGMLSSHSMARASRSNMAPRCRRTDNLSSMARYESADSALSRLALSLLRAHSLFSLSLFSSLFSSAPVRPADATQRHASARAGVGCGRLLRWRRSPDRRGVHGVRSVLGHLLLPDRTHLVSTTRQLQRSQKPEAKTAVLLR